MPANAQPVTAAPPAEADMFARARALVPVLAERAAACEELRRVPDETIADFVEAGWSIR